MRSRPEISAAATALTLILIIAAYTALTGDHMGITGGVLWVSSLLNSGLGTAWPPPAQFWVMLGAVAGAAIASRRPGRPRINMTRMLRGNAVRFVAGGFLMGLGAQLGHGCNVRNLWGSIPAASLQGWLFFAGCAAGAWFGLRLVGAIAGRGLAPGWWRIGRTAPARADAKDA